MKGVSLLLSLCAVAALGACGAQYTPPEDYGLASVRPYPNPDDVCQVIGETPLVVEYLDHTSLLIGCPIHEVGAMQDRQSEGAVPVRLVGRWLLFSIPVR